MTRRIIACALAMILASATGALSHGDRMQKVPAEKEGGHGGGHAAAVGKPGDPGKVSRTVEVDMGDDMRFRPDIIRVTTGETVRFILRNTGKEKHEMVLGTVEELMEHAKSMRKSPGMKHDDPNQAVVEPGKAGELVWQFTEPGTFDFACLIPGHFEAGMVGRIRVGIGE